MHIPPAPYAPHTPDECRRWQDLDRRFDTTPDSPLHHNNRCTAAEHVQTSRVRPIGILRYAPTSVPSVPRKG